MYEDSNTRSAFTTKYQITIYQSNFNSKLIVITIGIPLLDRYSSACFTPARFAATQRNLPYSSVFEKSISLFTPPAIFVVEI